MKIIISKIINRIKRLKIFLVNPFSSKPIKVNSYESYEKYTEKQLEKRSQEKINFWTNEKYYKDKTQKFIQILKKNINLINISKKSLSVGSRVGNEVLALKSFGIDCIGIDLENYGDIVIKGDMHKMPFEDRSFDLVFSNILDHSLYPEIFFKEVHRVLTTNGYLILHVVIGEDNDEYSTYNFFSVKQIFNIIGKLKVVETKRFAEEDLSNFLPLNTCIVLQKDT